MNNCADISNGNKTIFIVGPTASGKTDIAHNLACIIDNAEIVSADSMQIYKQMDILTAKPEPQKQQEIPYHLIDMVDVRDQYSAHQFYDDAMRCIEQIHSRNNIPVVVGGTGLYVRSLLRGIFEGPAADEKFRQSMRDFAHQHGSEALHAKLRSCDPESAQGIPHQNVKRVIRALEVYHLTGRKISDLKTEWNRPLPSVHPVMGRLYLWGIYWPRQLLYERINVRVDRMIEQGAIKEVKHLMELGIDENPTASQALGVSALRDFIIGNISRETAINLLKRNTRRFAKRQLTWFGREELFSWFVLYNDQMKKRIVDLMIDHTHDH